LYYTPKQKSLSSACTGLFLSNIGHREDAGVFLEIETAGRYTIGILLAVSK
jgi:hypothetical protein